MVLTLQPFVSACLFQMLSLLFVMMAFYVLTGMSRCHTSSSIVIGKEFTRHWQSACGIYCAASFNISSWKVLYNVIFPHSIISECTGLFRAKGSGLCRI